MASAFLSKIVLIAGPTASGKSALALALAERIGGAVINADSMQAYRELQIITARPTDGDMARAPHFLYGHLAAADPYSAGRYVADAKRAINEARQSKLVPIVVGGTGLYFKALMEGLAPVPPVDKDVRARLRAEAKRDGSEAMHAALAAADPEIAARLAPTDAQRVVRALEVIESTGRSLIAWQRERVSPVVPETAAVRLYLSCDRETLYARADVRVEDMIAAGAVREAADLAALGLDPALPSMRAIGVGPFAAAARGEIGLDLAAAAVAADTRHYIKRQETWARSNMSSWNAIPAQQMGSSIGSAISFIES